MRNKRDSKGFTLVELIVVIGIVAILSSMSVIGYRKIISDARNSTARSELDQVYNVVFIDAARPNEISDNLITTSGGKIKFTFEGLNEIEMETHLRDLLVIYLNAGFYQGEFIFNKNTMTYISPGGGKASREIDFDFEVEIRFLVDSNGDLINTP